MRTIGSLLIIALVATAAAFNTKPIEDQTPQEKLEALINAGLPPQILIATDVDKGDSDGLIKVSEDVLQGLQDLGIAAKVGFYLHMLSMFTLYASSLEDGLKILDFLNTHDHITNYEVDTITFPNPPEEVSLLDDDLSDDNDDAKQPPNLPPQIRDLPVLVVDHDDNDRPDVNTFSAYNLRRH